MTGLGIWDDTKIPNTSGATSHSKSVLIRAQRLAL